MIQSSFASEPDHPVRVVRTANLLSHFMRNFFFFFFFFLSFPDSALTALQVWWCVERGCCSNQAWWNERYAVSFILTLRFFFLLEKKRENIDAFSFTIRRTAQHRISKGPDEQHRRSANACSSSCYDLCNAHNIMMVICLFSLPHRSLPLLHPLSQTLAFFTSTAALSFSLLPRACTLEYKN